MTYFIPDRSNRPTDADDPTRGTTEIGTDRTKTLKLADGRVAIVEAAVVDGLTLVYYYFDATDLEDLDNDGLAELLEASGIKWQPDDPDTLVSLTCTRTKDAQGRDIYEAQITYCE